MSISITKCSLQACARSTMASLPHQIPCALGAYTSTNKNIITRPCIAQLHKKMHFGNLVANHHLSKPTLLSPVAFVAQKKPIRDLREVCQNEKWKAWCSHDGSSGVAPHEFPSPRSQLVLDFYEAVNEKNIQKLEQLLSPRHCAYHDLLFYGPYEGKQVSTVSILFLFEKYVYISSCLHSFLPVFEEKNFDS